MAKKEPAMKIQVGRGVSAAIWENTTKNGTRYAITVEERYKADDEWKVATSHFPEAALLMAQAFELAFRWTVNQDNNKKKAKK